MLGFIQGSGPAAALRQLKESLKPHEIANAAICPTPSQLYHTWNSFQKTEYGGRTNDDIFRLLEDKKEMYEKDGNELRYSRQPFAIAVMTPIMQRTAELYQDSEIMFVDSTASCDVSNSVVTFLLVATPAGGSPIAVLLTQSQSSIAYETGFNFIKEVILYF